MKKLMTFILCLIVLGSLTTMNSCKKETDDDSAYQEKGNYGNSNITTTVLSATIWTNVAGEWVSQLSVPAITAAVQSGGDVQVFLSIDNGTDWIALPFYKVTSGSDNYQMWYITSLNTVTVKWNYTAGVGVNPNTYYSATCQFKVVVTAPAG